MQPGNPLVGSAVGYGSFDELRKRGVRVHRFQDDHRLKPVEPGEGANFPADFSRELGQIPPDCVELENVYVFPSGAVLWEGLYFTREILFLNEKRKKRRPPPPHLFHDTIVADGKVVVAKDLPVQTIPEPTLIAANFRTNNFYHFCHEVLGRMYFAEQLRSLLGQDLTVSMSPLRFPMQRYLIEALWPDVRISFRHHRYGDEPCIAHYKRAWIARSPASPTALCAPALSYVRSKLHALGKKHRGTGRRVYISRKDGRSTSFGRTIHNENEVLDLLLGFGLEESVVGELTVTEQLQRFSSATVFVGVHGAGLTNMLFAPEGSALIEIGGAPTTNNHYARDAINLGFRYFYVPSTRVGDQIEPDLAILRSALEQAL